jgi:hypothetical protein
MHRTNNASYFAISSNKIAQALHLDEIGKHSLSNRSCSATETTDRQVLPQIRMLLERNAE